MLYNMSPFERVLGEAGGSLMLAVINGSVSYPERDKRPVAVRDLIATCLRVDPEQRPYVAQVITRAKDLLEVLRTK
jgi:hypothetical protein